MRILLLSLSLLFTQELEVSGSLKVSEGIDAQGQTISNVGSAVLDSDATNLSTVRSMLGMKPTRIYTKVLNSNGGSQATYQYTVPEDRFWIPALAGNGVIQLAAIAELDKSPDAYPVIFPAGMIVTVYVQGNSNALLTIYEYPISASGTEQGLDYVEP